MSSADRGLCQELTYGVVRWQATLDWLIANPVVDLPSFGHAPHVAPVRTS